MKFEIVASLNEATHKLVIQPASQYGPAVYYIYDKLLPVTYDALLYTDSTFAGDTHKRVTAIIPEYGILKMHYEQTQDTPEFWPLMGVVIINSEEWEFTVNNSTVTKHVLVL